MIELIIEDLEGKQVAKVSQTTQKSYDISASNQAIKDTINSIVMNAGKTGIPLRYSRRQRVEKGMKFLRLAQWLKPGDAYFLHALAEELVKHKLYAYTIDQSVEPNIACTGKK